jgi:hypothetical protein
MFFEIITLVPGKKSVFFIFLISPYFLFFALIFIFFHRASLEGKYPGLCGLLSAALEYLPDGRAVVRDRRLLRQFNRRLDDYVEDNVAFATVALP